MAIVFQLTDLEIFEISLVAQGANGQQFLVCKSAGAGEDVDLELVTKGENNVKRTRTGGDLEDILKNLPEDERAEIEKALKERDEQIHRELDRAKKAEDERKKAVEKATELEREKVEKAFVEKARGLKHISANPQELGLILKTISEASPEMEEQISTILKAADKAIGEGALYSEIGKEGSSEESNGDVWDKITKRAQALVEKSAGEMTFEKAVSKVLEMDPTLYKQFNEQQEAA